MIDALGSLELRDVIDIALIAFAIYWLLNLIRGTRAVQMLVGLTLLLVAVPVSGRFGLDTSNWVLDNFLSYIVFVIIVIFQNDLRRALTHMGTFSRPERRLEPQTLEEITRAAVLLASKRIGALIVLQRSVGLNEYIEVGTRLDAEARRELITSIFLPNSPIHDGALILEGGRIVAAGCFLPLTTNPNVSKTLGTRHRAAIGLTEETDAVVIVVSEEDGQISLVNEGRITRKLDAGTLRSTLQRVFSQ